MPRTRAQWEERFRGWIGGPGDTETQRCENAENMIRKAIASDADLRSMQLDVFAQGSYRNLTNIPQESDVDVAVCLQNEQFYYEIPDGTNPEDFGVTPNDRQFEPYRSSVHRALEGYFGSENITAGKKAIRIHSNTYRVDADVVPSWEFREYYDKNNPGSVRKGLQFYSTDGTCVRNYPKQHIANGISKNTRAQRRFKRLVRILKSLQVEMLDQGVVTAVSPSFFIESLVYNVPDESFGHETYWQDVRAVLAYIFNETMANKDPSQWVEVNDVKYLFRASQPWTQTQAHALASAAWDYIGFD